MTDTALSALQSIDAGLDREIWVKIGTAAKIAGISEQDFISWCQTGSNYSNDSDCKAAWKSFKTDGKVTEGTLYYHASQAGWKRNNANTEFRINAKPQEIWDKCVEATNAHPYISRKGGWATGLRVYHGDLQLLKKPMDGALVVPVFMGTRIVTLQFIVPDGEKINLARSKLEEGYYCIGKPEQKIYIVEGIGQAWAVNIATDDCAVVSFGDSRLNTVAEALRRKYPKSDLIIVPDRGKETKAAKVAKSIGGSYIALPEEFPENYDVNDYLQQHNVSDLSLLLSQPIETEEQKELEKSVVYGAGFCTHEQQAEIFKNYFFIQDDLVFIDRKGKERKPAKFDSLVSNKLFPLDADNKQTTRSASYAYLNNTVNGQETVFMRVFNPKQEKFHIDRDPETGECETINLYEPHKPRELKGDVTIFIEHLKKLFPDDNDREIIMSYIAAIAQNPGVKFNWCPMIQGGIGTGKSTIGRVLQYIVGTQYTEEITAKTLEHNTSKWKQQKFLVIINEIKIFEGKYRMWEEMKQNITEKWQNTRSMYADGKTIEVFYNFIMFTNHLDALPKTDEDRRIAAFKIPQQTKQDKEKWGMDKAYYDRLNAWLDIDGKAYLTHFFKHFDLSTVKPENNPVNQGDAPCTSTTWEVIEASRGFIEQEIFDKIEEGTQDGFKGNFVNINAVKNLLSRLNIRNKISPQILKRTMLSLGYEPHPNLYRMKDGKKTEIGRVTWLMDGNTKPYLYVRAESEESELDGRDIQAAYEKSNNALTWVEIA